MIGVIVISKLGLDQFDEDDLRVLEVLAGHASVALENARLYEAQRREAESADASSSPATSPRRTGSPRSRSGSSSARRRSSSPGASLWLQDGASGDLRRLAAHPPTEGDTIVREVVVPAEHLGTGSAARSPIIGAADYADRVAA